MPTPPNDAEPAIETWPTPADLAAGEALFRRPFTFLKSAPALEFLPPADRPEIAFAGRSNVGKSSLINALVRHKGLARTSNTPGRTQELNYFLTETTPLYLVDMPGYGFAEAPKQMVATWRQLVNTYLRGRATLARVYVLIDARHGIKPVDREIFGLLNTAAVSFAMVLTKVDKLSKTEAVHRLAEVTAMAEREPAALPRVLATSSETSLGIGDLRADVAGAIGFKG